MAHIIRPSHDRVGKVTMTASTMSSHAKPNSSGCLVSTSTTAAVPLYLPKAHAKGTSSVFSFCATTHTASIVSGSTTAVVEPNSTKTKGKNRGTSLPERTAPRPVSIFFNIPNSNRNSKKRPAVELVIRGFDLGLFNWYMSTTTTAMLLLLYLILLLLLLLHIGVGMTYYCRAGRWYGKRSVPSPVLSSYLTSPLNKHEPAPSTAFARARPSPPSFGSSGVTPALSIPHKKLRTSGRKPERPLMTDTTLAKIAARAAFSGREESAVTSEPLPETTQDNKNGKV